MSPKMTFQKPRSLTQQFEAPEDFTGLFGWVCGYSADVAFLKEALARFTGQSEGQRAQAGQTALALMLDPGSPQISFTQAPGLAHLPFLPIQHPASKPFVLMHAKVALLGFKNPSGQWRVRLVVSTGNWTRQTMEESLDLAWCVEVSSADLATASASTLQACADIKAAAEMFDWLKPHFDMRLLNPSPPGSAVDVANASSQRLAGWLTQLERQARHVTPRFFTSIKKSLLSQLPDLILQAGSSADGGQIKRNYLAMGSGFYEAASVKNAVPAVLQDIVTLLKQQDLLVAKPEVDLLVNQKACQAVAACIAELVSSGFTVRPAGVPQKMFGNNAQRFLHAKFIFSASHRSNSNQPSHAWLYLGSGNLTGPGFTRKASRRGGNVEAGVIFAPGKLYWEEVKGEVTTPLVTDLLPLQWATQFEEVSDVQAGNDMPERDTQYTAAPVALLYWCTDTITQWLQAPDDATQAFEVLDIAGGRHRVDANNRITWTDQRPLDVMLAWRQVGEDGTNSEAHLATVPVLDESGRISGTLLPKLGLAEAWWQLENFPLLPEEDDIDVDGEALPHGSHDPTTKPTKTAGAPSSYPIRQMMVLIENIADKQTRVLPLDWAAWCKRLEQCLAQTMDCPVLQAFKELELNPLSPLWQAPFRPDFADSEDAPEGQLYEAMLQRVEQAWNVQSLTPFGEKS